MMKQLILIFIFLLTHQLQASCIIEDVKIVSEEKVQDYINGKSVAFYPELKDFRTYSPPTLSMNIKMKLPCTEHSVKLDIYVRRGQRKHSYSSDHTEHNHEGHDHSKKNSDDIIAVKVINSEFTKNSVFTKTQKLKSEDKMVIKSIPHLKLYEDLGEKSWIDKVKYIITVLDKSGKKVYTRTIILDSPLII